MNPAWPIENWPVKPLTRFSDDASRIGDAAVQQELAVERPRPRAITTVCSTRRARCATSGPTAPSTPAPGPAAAPPPAAWKSRRPQTFSTTALPSRPLRADQQDEDEQREDVDVAHVRGQVRRAEQLDQTDQDAAEHRAAHVADAADHRGHERLEAEQDPRRCPPAG
jgi:hypothetical protein